MMLLQRNGPNTFSQMRSSTLPAGKTFVTSQTIDCALFYFAHAATSWTIWNQSAIAYRNNLWIEIWTNNEIGQVVYIMLPLEHQSQCLHQVSSQDMSRYLFDLFKYLMSIITTIGRIETRTPPSLNMPLTFLTNITLLLKNTGTVPVLRIASITVSY